MEAGSSIFLVILATITFHMVGVFNNLASLRSKYRNAFVQIEVQLKRRYQLIPILVASVNGLIKHGSKHEREILAAVRTARDAATSALVVAASDSGDAAAIKELINQERALAAVMSRFSEVMKAPLEPGANHNVMRISEQLTSAENQVAFSVEGFNDQVMAYNNYKQFFPAVLLASTLGHGANAILLQFENIEDNQQAPEVSF